MQLKSAYESVCNQTIKPEEIIIIDDASDEKIEPHQMKLDCQDISTIIERFEISKGACIARNRGVEIASGDILMFLDDDDTWEKTKIEDQLNIFSKAPNIDLVYSGKSIVRDQEPEKILYRVKPKASGKLFPQILYSNLIGTTSSVAMKKKFFHEIGRFDESMLSLQDYDLWIRACKSGIVEHDNTCNVRYTIYTKSDQQISGQSERHIKSVQIILDKYSQEIKSQPLLKSRQIKSSMLWYVTKSLRRQGLIPALPWIIRSFVMYPNLKILGLIPPMKVIQRLRKLL